MKLKCLIAALLCFVLLFCTACSINFEPIENGTTAKNLLTEATTVNKESTQAIYKKFLTNQFKDYVKNSRGSGLRTPPQFSIVDKHYAFYDMDDDGLEELIWLINSDGKSSANKVYSIYAIRNGTVMDININGYNPSGYKFYPEVMNDGSLRGEVGFGHVPGYEYMHLINGNYEVTDLITPPCVTPQLTQKSYEHTHYSDEYYTHGFLKENKKTETITVQEFESRVSQFNNAVTPAKLEVKSLLEFGQDNELSIEWLGDPTDSVTSFIAPTDAPLPRRDDLQQIYNNNFEAAQKEYKTELDMFNKPDAVFYRKKPANRYYAFYDLDGNGDKELFFGEENNNGKILITTIHNENSNTHIFDFVSLTPQDTYVLSNGRVVAEYSLPEGNITGKLIRYFGIFLRRSEGNENNIHYQYLALWSYGNEAAFYDYSKQEDKVPVSLTPEAYKQQKALLDGGTHIISLDWKPLLSSTK